MIKIKQTSHGYHGTKLYKLWGDIVKRCECLSCASYKYYGGSGITICKEWRESPKTFVEWAIENGYKEGLEIDRVNNQKNYSPDNCQFITHKENCAPNKRRVRCNCKSGERNIVVRPSGNYEVYAQINGKQKYIKTVATIEEGIKIRNDFEVIGNIHENSLEERT